MKLVVFSILLFIGGTRPVLADHPACRLYSPAVPDCQLYACMESRAQCGSEGYPLGFGKKYCDRFLSIGTAQAFEDISLSSAGIRWRDATLMCLQDELVRSRYEGRSCPELKTLAFESHDRCYTQPSASICDLPRSDQVAIFEVLDTADVLSFDGILQGGSVALTCLRRAVEASNP